MTTSTSARAAIDPDLAAEVRFRLVEMAVAMGHPLEVCIEFAREAAEFVIGRPDIAEQSATFTGRLAQAHDDLKAGRIQFGRIERSEDAGADEPTGEGRARGPDSPAAPAEESRDGGQDPASTDPEAQHVEETTHKPGGGGSNGDAAAEPPPSSTLVEEGLTANEQRLLDALIGVLDGGEGSPSMRDIAGVSGVPQGSINYLVAGLVKKGRLHSEHKDGKRFYRLLARDRIRAEPPRKPVRGQTDAERAAAIEAQRRSKMAPAAATPGHRICRNADCGKEFKPAKPSDLVCPGCVSRFAGKGKWS
jgi:hypothetical protein